MNNEILNIKTVQDYTLLEDHLHMITNIRTKLQTGENLADIIWSMESDGTVSKKQIPTIVHTLLIEKLTYSCISFNLSATVTDWHDIYKQVKTWNKFDFVIAYYHPQLDISLINPSRREHWERIESLAPYELMVIFTKARNNAEQVQEKEALADFKAACNGVYGQNVSLYQSEEVQIKENHPVKEESEPATRLNRNNADIPSVAAGDHRSSTQSPGKKKRKITPKHGVQVSNELFHNGNVEAWRNIIESYEHSHPGSTILLYHNGQRIKHISALFKWGKVKVGDSIFFSIVGEEIKSVAKLKNYLTQGASPGYKNFIKKEVGSILQLF